MGINYCQIQHKYFSKYDSPHLWTARLKKPSPQDTPTWTSKSNGHDLRNKNVQVRIPTTALCNSKTTTPTKHLYTVLRAHVEFCRNLALRVVHKNEGPDKIHPKHRNNSFGPEKHLPTDWGDQWQSLPERTPRCKASVCQTISRLQLGSESDPPNQEDPGPPQSLQTRQTLDWKETKSYPFHSMTVGCAPCLHHARKWETSLELVLVAGAAGDPPPGSSFVRFTCWVSPPSFLW